MISYLISGLSLSRQARQLQQKNTGISHQRTHKQSTRLHYTELCGMQHNIINLFSAFVVAIAWCLDDVITRLIFDQLRPWCFNFTSSRHFAHESDDSSQSIVGDDHPAKKDQLRHNSNPFTNSVTTWAAAMPSFLMIKYAIIALSGRAKKNFFGLPNLSLLGSGNFHFFFNLFFLSSLFYFVHLGKFLIHFLV